MMGWCPDCPKLVPIRRVQRLVGPVPDYKPLTHTTPDVHRGCGGFVKVLEATPDFVMCTTCGDIVEDAETRPGERCTGHTKVLR